LCDHVLQVCGHDILQTACGNSPNYTVDAVGYKEDCLDFRVKRSKVKVTARPNVVS